MAIKAVPNKPGWEQEVLAGIGAKPTPENIRAVHAWQRAEGGTASNNPFNTTQPAAGATDYNSVHVKNYTSPDQGIRATIDTLNNGRYAPIISAFRKGENAYSVADALTKTPWGSSGSLVREILGETGGAPPAASAPPAATPVNHALATNTTAAPVMQNVPQPDFRRQFANSILGSLDEKGLITQSGLASALQAQPRMLWTPQQTAPVAAPAAAPETAAPAQPRQPPQPEQQPEPPQGGTLAPAAGKLIGTPGSGTHSYSEGPNNWESDNAVDVAVPIGTPIRAPFTGVIGTQFGSLGSGGRFAGLRAHVIGADNEAYLAHLSKFAPGIQPGTHVQAGQIIGYSGEANGVAHLHFGLRNGNPTTYYG
jgi:murein DD-endopeptidase MepM/ murein hydrolase activator NlpD